VKLVALFLRAFRPHPSISCVVEVNDLPVVFVPFPSKYARLQARFPTLLVPCSLMPGSLASPYLLHFAPARSRSFQFWISILYCGSLPLFPPSAIGNFWATFYSEPKFPPPSNMSPFFSFYRGPLSDYSLVPPRRFC